MRLTNVILNAAILFAVFTGTALAAPHNGFGLNAGLVGHNRDCAVGCAGSNTSGMSLGMDYQFALSDKLSLNPFLMSSGETISNVSGTTVGHGILGVQLRYWAGDMFFGGHIGHYSEVLTNGAVSVTESGGGAGLVAGWEQSEGGLYVTGQLDKATAKYSGLPDIKLSGFRLSLGYRWK